ncbi:MAG: porin family protein [Prevotellaceae bacterium]|nr:porin family protein [Prevotellaceae bacterium]
MKKILKKAAIVVIAMVTMNVAAQAQEKGDMAVGANVVFGSGDNFSNYGIGAKFQYNVLDPLRLEANFTYFLEKDLISMWDFSVNAHWLFPVADKLTVYPLAGLGMLGTSVDLGEFGEYFGGSASDTEFGFNLGGGIDFKLTDKLILNAEVKYKLGSDWNRLLLSAGIAYRF